MVCRLGRWNNGGIISIPAVSILTETKIEVIISSFKQTRQTGNQSPPTMGANYRTRAPLSTDNDKVDSRRDRHS